MSDYLKLPELDGTVVSKGDPLSKGNQRPDRTTKSLSLDKEIPEKTYSQLVVEKANSDVVATRDEKERKKQAKRPVSKKRTAADPNTAPKKRKKIQGDEEIF